MTDNAIRMRLAPSPTGEPHIGTAYTALFNVLLARKLGGELILRIEDTDLSRSTPEAEQKLMAALNWIGLPWTEGPDKGGPYGPYRQSERKSLYRPYVDELLTQGHAFKCYCTRDRLDDMRKAQKARNEQTKYDGLCLRLGAEQIAALDADETPYVVRMKVPAHGECRFEDGVYGQVSIPYDGVDMQVILKADGMPTYHLANVVDDHLMRITHVARGEEWLSSVPKHLLLYEYFGWRPPAWYHLPLMRNPDRSKLSKRRNPTSLSYFSGVGYLPEALVNFLGLFFVTVAEGEEMMDLAQLEEKFDPAGMSKAGAVFDMTKLGWLNGRWIRERLKSEDFLQTVCAWAAQDDRLRQVLALAQSRISVLGELPALIGFAFASELKLTQADFAATKLSAPECLAIIRAVQPIVDTLPDWRKDAIHAEVERIAGEMGRKLRTVVPPLFVALTGSTRSLPLFDSMEALGRSIVRQRLAQACDALK